MFQEGDMLDRGHTARGACFHQGWADLRFCMFPPSALHVSLPWAFSHRYSQALLAHLIPEARVLL